MCISCRAHMQHTLLRAQPPHVDNPACHVQESEAVAGLAAALQRVEMVRSRRQVIAARQELLHRQALRLEVRRQHMRTILWAWRLTAATNAMHVSLFLPFLP